MSSAEPPRPVELTDELRAQLNSVSTATLTGQLQRRGIRSTFFSGLKPIKPGQRMLGYAHTLRYVPIREDLNTEYTAGQNAQRRAIESMAPEEILVIEARGVPDAGTFGDVFAMRALRRGATGIITDGASATRRPSPSSTSPCTTLLRTPRRSGECTCPSSTRFRSPAPGSPSCPATSSSATARVPS